MEKWRKRLEEKIANPPGKRTGPYADEWNKCAEDPVYWLDTYGRTYDPRTPGKFLPFKLFDKQKELIRWLQERERLIKPGLVEKSRDVGVSFICGAYALHGWLFRPGFKAGFGSRKLEYVDKLGDLDSIFEKIRFMLQGLPQWMLPKGFKAREHDCFTKLINPETRASITGEGGDEIGRGGRSSIYILDESAFMERPHLIDRAMSAVTNVRIDVSTPNGPGNPFAIRRFSGQVDVFTYHWRDDPRKDEAWAEEKRREKGPVIFASEYDIDYSASIEGICIPGAWVRTAVNLKLPDPTTSEGRFYQTLPDGRVLYWLKCVAGLDVAEEGDDLSVFTPRWGPVIGMPIHWSKLNTTQSAWKARDEAVRIGASEVYYDPLPSGIKGTWKSSEVRIPFTDYPVNTGASPTEARWPDGQTSKDKFFNLKAELWWRVRQRFERTWEFVSQGIQHPIEDLISIPDCPQLIAQLSLPLSERTDRGKIKIESKPAMKKRGIRSPDFADSLVLSEAAFAMKKLQYWIG